MPIQKITIGNLFESDAQTLVNPVNCVGVMGKGLALQFKKRFPDMFHDYAEKCQRNEVQLGYPYLYQAPQLPNILNFPTKNHWRSKSDIKAITDGLKYLVDHYKAWDITSLAVPALGCGLGQLDWLSVKPILEDYFSQLPIPVIVYAPHENTSK